MAWLCLGWVSLASAEPPKSAFVPGFDRFARHEEIDSVAGGRLLLTELSCTACHSAKAADLLPKRGPRLTGTGNRLQADWLRQFLSNPQHAKPGTTMPDVLAHWPEAEKAAAVQALVAFLGSQREAFPEVKASGLTPVPFEFWNRGDKEQGKQLYHQVGCVACHAPGSDYETVEAKPSPIDQLLEQLNPEELKEMGLAGKARRVESIPHGNLTAKYTRKSLTFFLLDPETSRPAGRMPGLKLKPVEAADIAAYLLRDQAEAQAPDPRNDAALIQQGRSLFVELGCVNCHDATGVKSEATAKPLGELKTTREQSCLGAGKRGIPHYKLDNLQTAALTAAVAAGEPTARTAEERLRFSLMQLNCYACHEYANQGGVGRYRKPYFETVGHVDIGDEGRLPPPLIGAGGKLQSSWMLQVLQGKGDIRPHMRIRMPEFPARATRPLPELFAAADHQGKRKPEPQVFGPLTGLAQPGRLLMDQGCVQCHAFRGEALPGVVGVDLEGITKRVHPEWFRKFLLDPGQLKPQTRMPTFFPNGQSQNKQVLGGHVDRQIAAMWAYLKELDKQPLPEKIEQARSQNYELKPQDRPLVLRTFMKEAGTHAIAVGFPQKVHFAFDAESARLAVGWRGRFLDAQGTWFSRFTPPAEPLGDNLISFPAGLPFAVLKEDNRWLKFDPLNPPYTYRGYRLDAAGVPTFLYRFGRYEIEDRIEPHGDQHLKRRWTITDRTPNADPPNLWFRPITGKRVKSLTAFRYSNDAGLTTAVDSSIGHTGEHRKTNSTAEWIIPLTIQGKTSIEVLYEW